MLPDLDQTILPGIVALRHELHQHPEIGFEEHWTSDRIARFLDEAGVPYKRGYAKGTGIVATLEGASRGKTVALRADMDGLEVREETGLPYASAIANRMHACGHDGHVACLCGAILALRARRSGLRGTVKFLFQPAEETAGAARFMVEDGAMDGVDAIFGLHGWPELPVGDVLVKPGPFMACADFFEIEVRGKGCHGAQPYTGVDPVVVAALITTALQTIVSREIEPWEPAAVSVGRIAAGTASHIIPDTALLEGTSRSFNPEVYEHIRRAVVRIAEHTALAHRATARVRFREKPYPALVNDAATTAFVHATAAELLGEGHVVAPEHPFMVAEDFAYYLEKAPGTFFFLGVNPSPGAAYSPLHSATYDFSDEAVPVGIALLSALAMGYGQGT